MNQSQALVVRKELRIVIDAYEEFLKTQMIDGEMAIEASEAYFAKDLVRSQSMGEISRDRAAKMVPHEESASAKEEASIGTLENPLLDEATALGLALDTDPIEDDAGSNKFWTEDWKDCIPCNRKWSLGDFNLDQLKRLLQADLMARFKWMADLTHFLEGNEILDHLCAFLHSLKNLCPQDLLVLVALMAAWMIRTLEGIKFNLESIIKDILGALLRPYISGLDNFLNMYIQFLYQQVECILTSISAAAKSLQDVTLSNSTLGPDSIHFDLDLSNPEVDKALDGADKMAARARKFAKEDTADFVREITDFTNFVPEIINKRARESLSWLESNAARLKDALIDLLGGEWLITDKNMSLQMQLRSVATIKQIIQVIYKLGVGDNLCDENNVTKIAGALGVSVLSNPNDGSDITEEGGSSESSDSGNGATGTLQQMVTPSSSTVQRRAPVLSLSKCLNMEGLPDDISKFARELA